jgi:hypothetical protein
MKIINIRRMDEGRAEAYRVCLSSSAIAPKREDVLAALMNQVQALDPGLVALGTGLPVPGQGEIDIVCADSRGQVVPLAYSRALSAAELAAGLARSDWANDNAHMLTHIYSRTMRRGDRCIHVADKVAPEAEALLRRVGPGVEVFICEALRLGDDAWLVLKRHGGTAGEAEQPGPQAAPKAAALKSVLTQKEIDEFFGSSGEEEITNAGTIFLD